jgi:hypothetical protein
MVRLEDTPSVQCVVQTYLAAVDEEAPGLVEGLYLTGSVALGDFRPHESDVDFVAVTAARPDERSAAALERAHARLRERCPRPDFEGIYVTWEALARSPAQRRRGPSAHGGRFWAADYFALNPVTWHTLARHGVVCRGPQLENLGDGSVWTDTSGLVSWCLNNLESYWRRWHAQHARLLSRHGLASLGTWAPAWGVLGVSRLHYTIATGEITSKEGAGSYALETFPAQWHRVIQECLRIRRRVGGASLYVNPFARRTDALAFMATVMEDARGLRGAEQQAPA